MVKVELINILNKSLKKSALFNNYLWRREENKPNKELLLTRNHTVIINNILNPISYYLNKTTVTEINNKDDVYNIILLNKNKITVCNLDCEVIYISSKEFAVLQQFIQTNNYQSIECELKSEHYNIRSKKLLLDINKLKEFINV